MVSENKFLQEFENSPVKLIAVSKLQPIDKIQKLYSQGQRRFAENYVQEATDKKMELKNLKDIEWHFIGHLQKNKVKNVVGFFEYIHSVDSIELAKKIDYQAQQKNLIQKIFIEINLAEENSKNGIPTEELSNFLHLCKELSHISVVGLMTMPPLFEDAEESRPFFRTLKGLAQKNGLEELSMGTSSDYKIAIEEGATMVRLGTILFGERPRNQ